MDPVLAGARLSHYQIERLLGAGGMGSVYLARDTALDRPVAIKLITPDRSTDESARRRLVREARAAAALDHPNICTVYEVIDDPAGPACIVMQYVEGETLATTLRRGPLEPRHALSLASDLASALAVAHRRGIVHRDLKPQNVIVTPDRHAKLLDFGIARYPDPAADSGSATTDSHLTAGGAVPGTPAYMSPEQVLGTPVDGRSDLFSLGVVLYECLTGRPAFKGANSFELASEIITHDPPAVSSLRTELSEAHDELCRRLLAKDKGDRFQSADELLGALRVLLPDTSRSGSTAIHVDPRPQQRTSVVVAAAGIALLAALVGVAWWWMNRPIAYTLDAQTERYYRQGVDAIRDGTPHMARLALTRAIQLSPEFPSSYIRLAEAETELDEPESAQQQLLRVTQLVPNESRLSTEDRTRVAGVRGLMLRDIDAAVRSYLHLARRDNVDAGAWLDVGRVQEAAARDDDALASYDRALQIDPRFAAAHLRRGTILGREGRGEEAMAAFTEAERLYHSVGNVEGQVETLLRRASFLSGRLQLSDAGKAAERARVLAESLQSQAQHTRAVLLLATIMADEGHWTDAQTMAQSAVDGALRGELEAVAAEGLVDLANVLLLRGRVEEADLHLGRAIQLAEQRGVRRIAERARLQRAYIRITTGRADDAIALARAAHEYFASNRYRRYEVTALSVLARAHDSLGELAEAEALARQALEIAEEIKDRGQVLEALENLAGVANARGALPEALSLRQRSLELRETQNDQSVLPYDLTNTADLLIRLGRHADAMPLLDRVDAGAADGVDAYRSRLRRAMALRSMSAAIQHRAADARSYAGRARGDDKVDSTSLLADALSTYASSIDGARASNRGTEAGGSIDSPTGRETRYWDLLARLHAGDLGAALRIAETTLGAAGAAVSPEFEWRVSAIGAAAAGQLKDRARETALRARASTAFATLRNGWTTDFVMYESRPDLVNLRRKAGL
jgi:tetratricopeptide (TPR) repeat protein